MAFSKKDQFHPKDGDLSRYAAALAHPARIAILKTLAQHKECVCGEIVEVLPLAQSTVSQHLKVLKDAGLIQGEIKGPASCYCINPKALEQLSDLFHGLLHELPNIKGKDVGKRKDCC
jgi:ArsR family transcriptional regulator